MAKGCALAHLTRKEMHLQALPVIHLPLVKRTKLVILAFLLLFLFFLSLSNYKHELVN